MDVRLVAASWWPSLSTSAGLVTLPDLAYARSLERVLAAPATCQPSIQLTFFPCQSGCPQAPLSCAPPTEQPLVSDRFLHSLVQAVAFPKLPLSDSFRFQLCRTALLIQNPNKFQ